MDGTLIDSLGFWGVMWEKIGDKYFGGAVFRPSEADDKALRTMILADVADMLHEHYAIAASGAELLAFTEEKIVEFYSCVKAKSGVLEFLENLQKKGVKMCLASATAPHLLAVALKTCGLEEYFEFIISCTDVGSGKDKPDIYLLARDFLGTSVEETWIFEDSHVAIGTAARLGMPTVDIWDKHNTNQDEIRAIATHYVAEGETLLKLI